MNILQIQKQINVCNGFVNAGGFIECDFLPDRDISTPAFAVVYVFPSSNSRRVNHTSIFDISNLTVLKECQLHCTLYDEYAHRVSGWRFCC